MKIVDERTNSKVTEIGLVYHNKSKLCDRPIVKSSSEAYDLLLTSWDQGKIELQEQFRIMFLDRRNACLGISTVATGGVTSCLVDLKIVFALALKARATGVILAHNHPSGNTSPSDADKTLTTRFAQAGRLLDLPILDHLIVCKEGYMSFADQGLMPFGF